MALSKPTILFLASWYPSPIKKSHGIFIRNHALALSNFCNVIIAYAYSDNTAKGFELTKNKVNEHFEEWLVVYKKTSSTTPVFSRLLKYLNFKKAYKLLGEELSAEHINVKAIQINTVYPAAMALQCFLKKWQVPFTVLEHWTGYLPEDGNYKGALLKYYTRKTIAKAAKIFHVSEKQKLAMLSHQLFGNYELIYNVVDTSIFNTKQKTRPAKPLFLHVSSLDDAQKNITGILNAIAALQKKDLVFDFIFIGGDKDLIIKHTNYLNQLKLKDVAFIGPKTQGEIGDCMQRSTALVLFSNYENMPVVVLEALACGLPVISSNTGHLTSIVRPEFGKLFSIGDEKELAKNINEILLGTSHFDARKMNTFIVSRAAATIVGKQLYDFYKSLIEA